MDLPYTASGDLRFDLHQPHDSTNDSPILVYVHGGAWKGEDKSDHAPLASLLVAASNCPVLVPNYRLTTAKNNLRHPAHAEDILEFLIFLPTCDAISTAGRPIYLIGHSAGAHIIASIFLDSSAVTPSLTPPPALLQAVKGLVLAEGIHDIDLLLTRFPTYRAWFIAEAFGDRPSYAPFSVTTMGTREGGEHLRWLVIHSTGDTLVDQPQSETMYDHLRTLYAPDNVSRSFDQLDLEHSDILTTPLFIDIVRAFCTN
ncbi:Alpha/Beta hydrolase protein [Roridomyces roridus]|uniref:Alpha/Beta hydrolase protein n=1 Tax=Roridomyces roridus TaxID=1738132 RepID=A0AAD7FQQ8_9AGAR|nr:Alpha/Beta hydrolase protein [Roridomyces roridus]